MTMLGLRIKLPREHKIIVFLLTVIVANLAAVRCGTCSDFYPSVQDSQVISMCKNGVYTGTEVFIEADLASGAIIDVGAACTCQIELLNAKRYKVETKFDGAQGSDCGTSLKYSGDVLNGERTIVCSNTSFDVTAFGGLSHNISVELQKNHNPYKSTYCSKLVLATCESDEFQCDDGPCVFVDSVCDGFPDCFDASDETACEESSTPAPVQPKMVVRCSESAFITTTTTPMTTTRMKTTTMKTTRLTTTTMTTTMTTRPCNSDEYRCTDGKCIWYYLVCDNVTDCYDGVDEHLYTCEIYNSNPYQCSDGRNIPGSYLCDDIIDCYDGGDETPHTCNGDVIDCGNPGDIPNGTMTSTNGTHFPSVITYSCDKGFSLLGHKTRTCQANGEWSGCNPRCQSNKAVLDLISSSFKIAFPGSNG